MATENRNQLTSLPGRQRCLAEIMLLQLQPMIELILAAAPCKEGNAESGEFVDDEKLWRTSGQCYYLAFRQELTSGDGRS